MPADFSINGCRYDPERIDTIVKCGTTEDWDLVNNSTLHHPFHVHTNPFQCIRSDGHAEPAWRDIVNVPAGARVRIRVRFADFVGRTVYHCHVLDYEDMGLMGTLDIRENPSLRDRFEARAEDPIRNDFALC
jgi:FtsP/CotA-like multicopper oxidase with cupredoxin domain